MLGFRILGPVELGDRLRQSCGRGKFAAFTAALVLQHNVRVDLDRLLDNIWAEPPASAVANLRTYAHRLRKLIGRDRLHELAGGYRLRVTAAECDHAEFRRLAGLGRAAARECDNGRALELFHQALALWRDDRAAAGAGRIGALGGWLAALDDERLRTLEDRAAVRVRLGQVPLAVEELRYVVAVAPARTRAWALQMRAHHRLGEHEAVAESYALARHAFRTELGLDVDPELTALRHRLVRRASRVPGAARAVPDRPGLRPCLPSVVPLAGREAVVTAIVGAASASAADHCPRVVVHGPAGAGKSVVALRAAHLVANRFPDGQLYLDLRRLVPPTGRAGPGGVVDAALRLLGDTPPPRTAEAELLLRSRMAGRRLLVVVDHVAQVAQVAAFVAPPPNCALIVTADRPLGSLDASARVAVGPLSREASMAMLWALVGPARATRAELVSLAVACRGLPAALRLAAAQLIDRPDLPAGALADDLAGHRHPLARAWARDGRWAAPGDVPDGGQQQPA